MLPKKGKALRTKKYMVSFTEKEFVLFSNLAAKRNTTLAELIRQNLHNSCAVEQFRDDLKSPQSAATLKEHGSNVCG